MANATADTTTAIQHEGHAWGASGRWVPMDAWIGLAKSKTSIPSSSLQRCPAIGQSRVNRPPVQRGVCAHIPRVYTHDGFDFVVDGRGKLDSDFTSKFLGEAS